MIGRLFGKKKDPIGGYPELREEVRKIIISASGNVGGNVCDVLLPHAVSQEQRSYLMMESGFLGVAVASYFYVVRYRKQLDIDSFSKAVFEDYKKHIVASGNEIPSDQRRMLDYIFTREGFPAIEAYMRALKSSEAGPEEALVVLNNELVDRIRRLGGITISAHTEDMLQSKMIDIAQSLMQSFRQFFG